MNIAIIAAISPKNAIGLNGKLPWNLPEDLAHFKKLTLGQVVIMGRNTWNSLPEKVRPLPGRTNIVITSKPIDAKGATICSTVDEALNFAKKTGKEVFIIGGAQLYSSTINFVDVLHISHVNQNVNGDVFFPEIKENEWKCVEELKYNDFTYKKYIRK